MDAFSCRVPDCKFSLRRWISGREITEAEAMELISKGQTPVLEGFISRFGKPFDAALKLDEKFRAVFSFDDEEKESVEEELTEEMKIGNWEIGGTPHAVYETEKAWKIPTLTFPKEPKGLSISRRILSRDLPVEQVCKLVSEGKSDLIKGFVSQRTKKAFDAYLTFDSKTGKVGFEFEPRAPKAKKATKTTKATGKKSPPKKDK